MPLTYGKMRLRAPMWTDLNSPQKGQVDVFTEHPVVWRVAADGLVRRAVEYKHRGGYHFPNKKLRQRSSVKHAPGHVHDRALVSFAEAVLP